MRSYALIKKLLIAAAMIISLILIISGGVPELPSSKPESTYSVSPDIKAYLAENILAIGAFIIYLTISIAISAYGIFIRRNTNESNDIDKIWIDLGIFTFLSGVWILTDSRALEIFTYSNGRIFTRNTVIFISFISIMLMPIAFLAFLRHMNINNKGMLIADGLFHLTFFTFVLCCTLRLSKHFYFGFLVFFHLLICTLIVSCIIFYFRNIRHSGDKKLKSIFNSIILFMISLPAALIIFYFKEKDFYSLLYTVGFFVLNINLMRISVKETRLMYKEISKSEAYKLMAYTDSLTSIENRNAFIKMENEIKIDGNTSFIIMDINGLKRVNDTRGHHYGDKLIRRAAEAVKEAFSPIGSCYRIGGDEFAVICQNISENLLKETINNMLDKIEAENANTDQPLSLAYGYAFGGEGNDNAASLFAAADIAMYLNKKESLSSRR